MIFWNLKARLQADRLCAQGDWLVRAEKDQEALHRFTEAIAADPKCSDAYRKQALTYYSLAQYSKALEDFEKCIQIDPKHPFAYLSRGSLYLTLKDYPLRGQDCTMVLSLLTWPSRSVSEWFRIDKAGLVDVHRSLAHLTIARAELALGNFEAAVVHSGKAIAIRPDDAEASEVRAEALKFLGKMDLAQIDASKAAQLKADAKNLSPSQLPGENKLPLSPLMLLLSRFLSWLIQSKIAAAITAVGMAVALLVVMHFLGLGKGW
jgi:tetratricopeptide (TPR) repeat protein